MEPGSLGLYVAASLALIATPGQDMVYVVTRSLAQGRLAGVCSALGVSLGILVHTAAAALGAGALLAASEAAFLALKLAGAAYLVFLGLRLIFSRASPMPAGALPAPVPPAMLVAQGMLSNVTNPKIALFFFAFLPQFVDPAAAHPARSLVLLGVLYAAMAFPVKAAVGWAAGSFAARVLGRPGLAVGMNRASGAVLVALGLRLAAAERA